MLVLCMLLGMILLICTVIACRGESEPGHGCTFPTPFVRCYHPVDMDEVREAVASIPTWGPRPTRHEQVRKCPHLPKSMWVQGIHKYQKGIHPYLAILALQGFHKYQKRYPSLFCNTCLISALDNANIFEILSY